MLTLALDTTTRGGSVAVVRDAAVLAIVQGDASRTHGERLPGEIERALHEAGVAARDLELLVVASGPGAFTGLRIGLASMQGLAMVLGVPVVAVSALDALALAAAEFRPADRPSFPVATWMDAARGEVFAALYTKPPVAHSAAVPIVATPDFVLHQIDLTEQTVFIGNGAVRYRAEILGTGQHHVLDAPEALAPWLAHIGIARARGGEAGPPHALQPLYVRRPDAELERERRGVS